MATAKNSKTATPKTTTEQTDIVQTDTVQTEQTEQTDTQEQDPTTPKEQRDQNLLAIAQELSIDLNPDHTNDQVKTFLQSLDILTLGQTVPNPTVKFLEFYGYKDLTAYKNEFSKQSIITEFKHDKVKDQWLLIDNYKLSKDTTVSLLLFSHHPDIVYVANDSIPLGVGHATTYTQFLEWSEKNLIMALRLIQSKEDQTLLSIPLVTGLNPVLAGLKDKIIKDLSLHEKMILNPQVFTQDVFNALNMSYGKVKNLEGKKLQDYIASGGATGTARKSVLLPGVKVEANFKRSMKQLMTDFS
jgi:hypothetical protein